MFDLRTNWTLDGWQTHLDEIYGEVNSSRGISQTFARVTEMATGISRGVRENDPIIRATFFPRFLAWLLGLSSQLGIRLEEAAFEAYPSVCPYCRETSDCVCKIRPVKPSRGVLGVDLFVPNASIPETLVEWVGMYFRIYGRINKESGSLKMLGHFMEELGEVSEIIRFWVVPDVKLAEWKVEITRDNINLQLRQELADLFAWFCGMAAELGVELDADMKQIYLENCPVCFSMPCDCDPNRVHTKLRLGSSRR